MIKNTTIALKKTTLFISCIHTVLCSLNAFAQSINESELHYRIALLNKDESFQFQLENNAFKALENPKFYLENSEAHPLAINADNIHYVDINNDGKKDVIYQDNRGYATTVVFIQNNNSFVEVWNGPSQLIATSATKDIKTIYIRSMGIGCFELNVLIALTINKESVVVEDVLSHHFNTIITELHRPLKRQRLSGILRTTAVLDNTKKDDPCTGEKVVGNHIRVLYEEEVTILKEEKEWALIYYEKPAIKNSIISWIKK